MTEPMSEKRRAAIEERHASATEGPWFSDDSESSWRLHGVAFRIPPPLGGKIPEQVVNKQILKAPKHSTPYAEYWPVGGDADFITHAWEDVRDLLADNRLLRKVIAERSRLTDDEQSALPPFWQELYERLRDPAAREAFTAQDHMIPGAAAAELLDEVAELRQALLRAVTLPPTLNRPDN